MESEEMTSCFILISQSLDCPSHGAGKNSNEQRPNPHFPRSLPDVLLTGEGQRSVASCLPKRGQSGLIKTKNKP